VPGTGAQRACWTVSRFLYPEGRQSFLWAGHCCQALATYPRVGRSGPLLLSYLVLLRMGFTLPDESLHPRCALTAPFHPYRRASLHPNSGGIFSVVLSVKPALSESPRPLAGMLPYGDRTFLPRTSKTDPRATTRTTGPTPFSQKATSVRRAHAPDYETAVAARSSSASEAVSARDS
jgi:hypothetical protein